MVRCRLVNLTLIWAGTYPENYGLTFGLVTSVRLIGGSPYGRLG